MAACVALSVRYQSVSQSVSQSKPCLVGGREESSSNQAKFHKTVELCGMAEKLNTCLKCFVVFINVVFFLFGCLLIAGGVYILTNDGFGAIDTPILNHFAYAVIGIGIFTFILSAVSHFLERKLCMRVKLVHTVYNWRFHFQNAFLIQCLCFF